MTKRKSSLPIIIFLILLLIGLGFGLRAAYLRLYRTAYPIHYQDTVLSQAAETGLPPELIFAVIRCESGFDPQAVSWADARGLMQITEETFEWIRWRTGDEESRSYEELFQPEMNIRYGAALLELLVGEFETEREALAAYHTGRSRVQEWLRNEEYSSDGVHLEVIPSQVTGSYVDKVLDAKEHYQRLYQFEDRP